MTFLVCALLLYFLPAIVAHSKPDSAGVFIVNLLFGWTVIGWLIALVWACASEPRMSTWMVPAGSSRYFCRCGALQPVGAHFCWACGRNL
ncbi:MAG: superinfection immunity protein [Candidatus Acidiferrales bacterium]